MKKILKTIFHRVFFVGISLFIQLMILIIMISRFSNYFVYFYIFNILLSIIAILYIVNDRSNPGYKIAWLIPILLFPIFGGLIYLMFGRNKLKKRERKKMQQVLEEMKQNLNTSEPIINKIRSINARNQATYIEKFAYCPLYDNTYSEYFPIGEKYYEKLLEELKKAKHYIFLEYFIIEEGKMWNTILDILVEKVNQGIDVRIIYDDLGCIMTLPYRYEEKLKKLGIKCSVFNPFIPILSTKLNNRNHRKIAVIDGHTGFTGGINLADEYINNRVKYGHWKDNGVMLKGDAVWSLTVMFLSMWDSINNQREKFEHYKPTISEEIPINTSGFVQPYVDSPLDFEPVGESVYLNLINKAKKYIYITTPYLIIDNEMITALTLASKNGIDIKIITPFIPDKKTVNELTKAYYDLLIESGIEIYEYLPGFIHAKTFLVDDKYATVGTINLDYRSLYLHFECGVWLYQTDSIQDIKKDIKDTLDQCKKITKKETKKIDGLRRLKRAVLRVIAPLL